jgi:predicted ferric reductase
MNEQAWWYLSRSTGIIALVALVLSLVVGVLLSTRVLRPHDRPAWMLDLHGWLGGSAVVMTGFHLVGLALDGYVHFGVLELLVPGASAYRSGAVAVGVVAMYLLVAVQLTAVLRRRLPRWLWRGVHYASYALVWGGLVHAGLAGTDVSNRVYQAVAVVLTLLAVTAAIVRIVSPSRGRRPATATAGSSPGAARLRRAG